MLASCPARVPNATYRRFTYSEATSDLPENEPAPARARECRE